MGIVGQFMSNSLIHYLHWNTWIFKHTSDSDVGFFGQGVIPDRAKSESRESPKADVDGIDLFNVFEVSRPKMV